MTVRPKVSNKTMKIYCHAVPGRLRVKLPGLKGSPREADRLAATVRHFPGVTEASANPTTGSLLVLFDARQTDHSALLDFLRERGEIRADLDLGSFDSAAAATSSAHPLWEIARWAGSELGKEILVASIGHVLGDTPWSVLLAIV